ncbi:MAG: hypothetical protein WBC01_08515 [Solirubrobacterales bacterium]
MTAGRTGFHGLPADYRTPPGEPEDWEAALGYLRTLANSRRPIVAAIVDPRSEELNPRYKSRLTQQIGFLQQLPVHDDRPAVHRFALNWPDPNQPCGEFTIDKRLFEGASLGTIDGDDYFGLELDLGPISVLLLDTNTNMENAYRDWGKRYHQTYLDLPSASDIEKKWRAEPNREHVRAQKQYWAHRRAELVKRGAVAAEDMSDAALEAAGQRVAWYIHTSGRASTVHRSEWRALYLEEFSRHLRDGLS